MSKPRLAFVDIAFHRKTRSSDFFIRMLEREHAVDVYHLDPDPRALLREIVDGRYDLIVCWQSEFCAPYFIAQGQRVVCIPMFDGVEHAPDWYWQMMSQARFISFSRKLHLRLRGLGVETVLTQYFPEPGPDEEQADFSGELRALFWQRRPDLGLDFGFARRVLSKAVRQIHIHNGPDLGTPGDYEPDLSFTVSHFGSDRSAYEQALAQSNVFLCPRYTEGIGLAMLEALSRGMCVIANDAPTANEYIVSGVNGLLINYSNPHPIRVSREEAANLGKAARRMYVEGHSRWEQQLEALLFYVATAPESDVTQRDADLSERYLMITKYFARDHARFMAKAMGAYLSGLRLREASRVRLRERLKWFVASLPGVRPLYRLAWRGLRRTNRLLAGLR